MSGLTGRVIPHLIDGEDVTSATTFADVDPWTREEVAQVAAGSTEEVEGAVGAARRAFDDGPWPRMSSEERGAILHRLADLILAHADELATADRIDMGRPVSGAHALDVTRAAANFRFFADHARLTTADTYPGTPGNHAWTDFTPAGVVGAITPWNHPLMLGSWKIAAPLAWGDTVVHKPAEDTPTSAYLLAILALEAGIPPGVLNVVQGTGDQAGAALTKSSGVDRLTFTGSTEVGRRLAAAAAVHLTPVSLELGGKGANLVFEDADLDRALTWTQRAIFNNSGQVCLAASRIYVHERVFEEFRDRLAEAADALMVGDPSDPSTDLGPLASEKHHRKVTEMFDLVPEEGGEVVAGGPAEGWCFRPTVVTGADPRGRLCREEIFGPMALMSSFASEDEAIALANATPYGLSALVFTENLARAHRVSAALRAGTVWVNCYQIRDLRAPLGGPGWSGIGREGGDFSREFFTEPKVTVMATD